MPHHHPNSKDPAPRTSLASLWRGPSALFFVSSALRVAGGLLSLPIALRVVPTSEMGLYYTFLAIGGLVALLDFGFGPSTVRNVGYAMGGARNLVPEGVPDLEHGGPNLALLGRLLSAVARYYRRMSLGLTLVLLSVGSAYVWTQIAREGLSPSLMWAWGLFAASQIYRFYSAYWDSFLVGIGEMRAAASFAIIAQVVGLVVSIGGLLAGASIWSYGLSSLASALIGRRLASRAFLKAARLERVESTAPDNELIKAMWPMAWRQGVVMVGAFFVQRASTLVCASQIGLEETAQYGLTVSLVTLIFQLSTIPLSVVMPRVSRLRVARDFAGIWSLFSTRLYAGLGLAALGTLALALVGNTLLVWIGAKTFLLPADKLLAVGLVWWLETHHSQYATLVLTENKNPFLVPSIASGVLVLAVSWWAAGQWGIWGLILAQGIVQLAWNNWWPVMRGLQGLRDA